MESGLCGLCFEPRAAGTDCARCGPERDSTEDPGDVLSAGALLNGKYSIGRLLGRGGFGATYLAWDNNLRVRLAIKEYLPRQLASRTRDGTRVYPCTGDREAYEAGLQQFLMEAQNLAKFRHFAGIIAVLDYFPENGTGYMAMEYLDGRTLEDFARAAGRIEPKLALNLVVPVADALRACHSVGLIHRDVSPDNIFITADDCVKLLDFGAARIAASEKSVNLSVILKEGYAPFEQYQRNGRQGPWTDVYALTGTLYRLLTSELPPTALDRAGGEAMPRLSEKGVDAPPRLQALVDKGLALAAAQRHQTIVEFLDDLRPTLEALEQAPPEPDRKKRKREDDKAENKTSPDRKRWRALAVAAVAGLVIGPIVALSLLRDQSKPTSPAEPRLSAALIVAAPAGNETAVLSPAAEIPAAAAPVAQAGVSAESLQRNIRAALEAQSRLSTVASRLASTRDVLRNLESVSADPAMDGIVKKTRGYYEADLAQRDRLLGDYLAQVDWLAGHDPPEVDRAFELQSAEFARPGAEADAAGANAWAMAAMRRLEGHVAAQRRGRLVRDQVLRETAAASAPADRGAGA